MEGSQSNTLGKKLILYGVFLFLFIPLIQSVTHLKKHIHALDGAFYPEPDIDFSWDSWFKGDYSSQKDKFIRENFGFRNYYVRLICQVNFDLFKKANVSYVVVGKDNYLYETAYINAYYGRDFIGSAKIVDYAQKLRSIQDTLQKLNKLILVAMAPGKACFYPEYIPENFKTTKQITNYDGFIAAFKAGSINHIDFYKSFRDQKSTSPYPLYPQLGIHWSDYGSIKAMDSIVRYSESKLGIDLPDLVFKNVEVSDSLRNTDNDAIKSLNLFRDPGTFKMAYPNWEVRYDSTRHRKPNLLVVSDSFWWYIYSTGIPDQTFAQSRFWYYNKEMYPESYTAPVYVSQVDYASKIRQADVIVIMHAEATLHKFGGGFVDLCYETFYKPEERRERIQEMKEKIRGTPEWFKEVSEKAQQRNLSVDSMLTLDAIYMIDKQN